MQTRVKVCGITSVEDAIWLCQTGVNAIGLVFYEKSPRYVTVQQAIEICEAIPPFISIVGLFVNKPSTEIEALLAQVPLDLLQFHGTESAQECGKFFRPYIKAVPMQGLSDFSAYADQYPDAKGFLVDSHAPDSVGGSGKTFDWTQVPHNYPKPIILAGGLQPENIAAAIEMTNVYAVDVSSGVESSPGQKDKQKVEKFMQEVKCAI
jgi:phosphoribosylanthranilate isomerase